MFQDFDDKTDPTFGGPRLAALRGELKKAGLHGFLVPHADRFQGEYMQEGDERLMWLTGFSGSAGSAVALADKAAVFVDGRYTVQAAVQVDGAAFSQEAFKAGAVTGWLRDNVPTGKRIGYDPWLHTASAVKHLRKSLDALGVELVAVDQNPIDNVWRDRPVAQAGKTRSHPLEFAGQSTADKLAELRQTMDRDGEDACVLSLSDGICWLFNIRGTDVIHTPIVHGFAIIEKSGASLFLDQSAVDDETAKWLAPHARLFGEGELASALDELGAKNLTVRLDLDSAADWLATRLKASGAEISDNQDLTIKTKARKNPIEAEGARSAHKRDAVPMARFLAWVDGNASNGETGSIDEISAAKQLERFRTETNQLLDISFDTISAAGPNAALPHYRVSTKSNRTIEPGSFFLIDSGGQYRDGTTDITRTIAIGDVSPEMKRRYTQVLKGHIAIATARFPKGTTGGQLDTLARLPLWLAGEDFDHGTGHGVGSYLSVHEGPQRISKVSDVPLEPGMILSNEPGFYREGEFGIRIENLIIVTEPSVIADGSRPMMGFETISYTPIDVRPIDLTYLDSAEFAWLNAYHAETRLRLSAELEGADLEWMLRATEPLKPFAGIS